MKKITYILAILILITSCSKHIKSVTSSDVKTHVEQKSNMDSTSKVDNKKNKVNNLSLRFIQISIDTSAGKGNLDEKLKKIESITGVKLTVEDIEGETNGGDAVLSVLAIDSKTTESDSVNTITSVRKEEEINSTTDNKKKEEVDIKKGNSIKSILILALVIIIFVFLIIIEIKGGKVSGIFKKIFVKKAA